MTFKLNISDKGKSWKLELESTALIGKSIGDKINGKELKQELDGYEFEITGGSDFSGFPLSKNIEGIGLKRVLLTKGWGMHKRPKGNKKKRSTPKGLRLRKTVRGKIISESTVQINLNTVKEGSKHLAEIFPDQKQPKAQEKKLTKEKPAKQKMEDPIPAQ